VSALAEELDLAAAAAAGLPVVDQRAAPDPGALRLVPPERWERWLPLAFEDGFLTVAFCGIPSPAEVAELERLAGVPVRPAVASQAAFASLGRRAARAAPAARATPAAPAAQAACDALLGRPGRETGDGEADERAQLAERVLDAGLARGASDIHLSIGSPPLIRAGGTLAPLEPFDILTAADIGEMAAYLLGAGGLVQDGDRDRAVTHGQWRFRVNGYRQRGSWALALRAIPATVPAFEKLGLPEAVRTFASMSQGLVLATGPSGAGKSTTLAALVDLINQSRAVHIITIEDPIEYLHGNKRSLVHQREVGPAAVGGDTPSFAAGIRSALREDPDVIMVGEMRDLETISAALTAAETGHLVLSTLHSTDAESTVARVIDVFPPTQQEQVRVQLAAVLRGVVCQSILPRNDRPGARWVVAEVMVVTAAIAALIRESATHQLRSHIQAARDRGMQSFDYALAAAVASGMVAATEAARWVRDTPSYRDYLSHFRREQWQG